MLITAGVVLTCTMILRWKRDAFIVLTSPSEILLIGSKVERRRVYGEGKIAFLKTRSTWIALIGYAVGLVVLSLGIAGLTIGVSRAGQWSVAGVNVAAAQFTVTQLLLIPIMWVRERKWMRVYLRQYLNEHGIPICRNCGYDLRGHASRTCSECGTAFDAKDTTDNESQ